jgi:predicted amidohydrolase YtcJ
VQAAVNHPCDDESIDVEQALRLFTSNGARIAGNDPRNGLLVEGGPADLVVLDSDPLTRDSHELAEICVLATVVAGIPRYLA